MDFIGFFLNIPYLLIVEPLSFNTMVSMVTIKTFSHIYLALESQLMPLLECQSCLGCGSGFIKKPYEIFLDTTNNISTPISQILESKL